MSKMGGHRPTYFSIDEGVEPTVEQLFGVEDEPQITGTIEQEHGAWLLTLERGEEVLACTAGETARRLKGVARRDHGVEGPWLQPRPGLYVYNWPPEAITKETQHE